MPLTRDPRCYSASIPTDFRRTWKSLKEKILNARLAGIESAFPSYCFTCSIVATRFCANLWLVFLLYLDRIFHTLLRLSMHRLLTQRINGTLAEGWKEEQATQFFFAGKFRLGMGL